MCTVQSLQSCPALRMTEWWHLRMMWYSMFFGFERYKSCSKPLLIYNPTLLLYKSSPTSSSWFWSSMAYLSPLAPSEWPHSSRRRRFLTSSSLSTWQAGSTRVRNIWKSSPSDRSPISYVANLQDRFLCLPVSYRTTTALSSLKAVPSLVILSTNGLLKAVRSWFHQTSKPMPNSSRPPPLSLPTLIHPHPALPSRGSTRSKRSTFSCAIFRSLYLL